MGGGVTRLLNSGTETLLWENAEGDGGVAVKQCYLGIEIFYTLNTNRSKPALTDAQGLSVLSHPSP